jgi:hypothetical protein
VVVAVVVVAAVAAPNISAAASDCSATNASAAATAAGFYNDEFPDGKTVIIGVICGPFFGPGSQGMAGMVPVHAGCGVSVGWAVFRFTGASWQLVMKQDNGAKSLQAVGSDIRETQGDPRPDDPYCHPSRSRARIWHWNGTQFVAGPWKQTTKGGPARRGFYSPSHSIACGMFDDSSYRYVNCQSYDAKLSQTVKLNRSGRLAICQDRGTRNRCNIGNPGEGTPTLSYGKQITVGRFRCLSLRSGMRCTVIRSGKGFLISRAGVRRVGP